MWTGERHANGSRDSRALALQRTWVRLGVVLSYCQQGVHPRSRFRSWSLKSLRSVMLLHFFCVKCVLVRGQDKALFQICETVKSCLWQCTWVVSLRIHATIIRMRSAAFLRSHATIIWKCRVSEKSCNNNLRRVMFPRRYSIIVLGEAPCFWQVMHS